MSWWLLRADSLAWCHRVLISPLSLAGLGRGRGFGSRCFRKGRGGFVPLPRPELLLFCVPKREVAKRKGHPDAALSGPPALRVCEAWPGFSAGLLPGRKGIVFRGDARCAA